VLTAGCHGHLRPAHHFHHGPRRHAEDEQHGGGGVARVVQSSVSDAGCLQKRLPSVVIGARVDGPPVRLEKYPISFLSELCCHSTFFRLIFLVLFQGFHERRGKCLLPGDRLSV
jgi:hypothetical protein